MSRSESLFQQAAGLIPGGVNSPVRAFKSVGGFPRFIREASGATVTDEDGKTYIDYVGSWGPMILGHAPQKVVAAVQRAAANGCSYGAPTQSEILLAEKVIELVPSIEMVRLVNSGTEATMSALRLARAATGRDAILKFDGCYHGHADSLLVAAGSGAATFGTPSSPGVTRGTAKDTLTVPFNDMAAVEACFAQHPEGIAAVIVEPVAGNMGCVLAKPGFLQGLRDICTKYGTVLIFDEVMTGFRVDLSCAQGLYDIKPDLTCLGKVIGGGLPVGAYGGKAELMNQISPAGPVYQAGTLSGNPLATAAGLATLEAISEPGFYQTLTSRTQRLTDGIGKVLDEAGIPHVSYHVGSMFGLFFTEADEVMNVVDATHTNHDRFKDWFHGMLNEGVYFAPSGYEAGFVSIAHDEAIIDQTIEIARKVAKTL
ncbi:glutamate-1-semialdehyde 2,1-aminomutase [Magnetococcus sp. PR-3]|uniref:glutamate-1-semialdehyde 2,1-aminomutase n=1 Tax=Magnetococcus sp. PR-3 TaxID=3120355 RepID=UPI002FCDEA78